MVLRGPFLLSPGRPEATSQLQQSTEALELEQALERAVVRCLCLQTSDWAEMQMVRRSVLGWRL